MSKNHVFVTIGSSVIISWLIFELIIDNSCRRKLKKQLLKIISDSKSDKFSNYYSKDIKLINNEISSIQNDERNHTLTSFKRSFSYRSSSNLESYIKTLNLYDTMRNIDNDDLIFQKNSKIYSYLISIDKMLWYPYICRYLFSLLNYSIKKKWEYKYSLNVEYFGKFFSYRITKNNKYYDKTMLLFIGFGGILQPFDKIIDLLLQNNYQIVIPIYGPSQASLDYNIDCHEAEFHEKLYSYISNMNINNIQIICWSLGGILYKGFENFVNNCSKYNFYLFNKNLKITKVILFEPLLGVRASSDTYFSQIRNYKDTLYIMNKVTDKKYTNYNYIFSYFIHTIIGFSTCASFGYFSTIELKNKSNSLKFKYPRYLFISSDDIICNEKLDKELIESNFKKENIYRRKGYHGGWLFSNNLIPTLEKIISK